MPSMWSHIRLYSMERTTTWSSPLMTSMSLLRTLRLLVFRTFLMLHLAKGTCHLRLMTTSSRFCLTFPHHQPTMLGSSLCLPSPPPHASAWLSVMPTPQLNLHLEPPESGGAQMVARNGHLSKYRLSILSFSRP